MTWASYLRRGWTCGHPTTAENTQSIGGGGRVACKICRRRIARESRRRCFQPKKPPKPVMAEASA